MRLWVSLPIPMQTYPPAHPQPDTPVQPPPTTDHITRPPLYLRPPKPSCCFRDRVHRRAVEPIHQRPTEVVVRRNKERGICRFRFIVQSITRPHQNN
jgi:hypothetical protein